MKIGAIKRVITQGKKIVIYEDGGQQWIGTEDACYLLDGVRVDKNSVENLLDISPGKMDEMIVEVRQLAESGLIPETYDVGEVRELMPVVWGHAYIPLEVGDELYLLDDQKRKAAKTGKEEPFLRMARNASGDPLVLAYDDAQVQGIIRPESMTAVEVVLDQARKLMHLKIGSVYVDGAAQITIREVMQGDDEDDAD